MATRTPTPPPIVAPRRGLAYAPAPESTPVTIAPHQQHRIGDGWLDASDGGTIPTIEPATETVLAQVARGTASDVDRAVRAARAAHERVWAPMPPLERGKYLFRIARAITERSRELAVLESRDGGKPIKESRDLDIPLAAAHFFYHAGWADKLAYLSPARAAAPYGVVGAIVPWNFPLLMAAWKIAPALAAGNTIVLKPAETTPLTALELARIAEACELPPGVLNVVTGDGAAGAALVGHPGVDKIAFTGSTEVGRSIARALAGMPTGLTLELGGKSATIVYPDAPLDQAVEGIIGSIYLNQGHVCCAGSRLLVAESVHDALVERLAARLETLRVGDPLDKNTDLGAINSAAQHARIRELIASGVAEGASYRESSCALPERGWFLRPSFFTDVQPAFRIAREEIFGPVLSIMTFRTPDEAVEKANATPYGLAAGVWTTRTALATWTAQRLRAGVVWCSTANRFDPSAPFGGYRQSGFGREGGATGMRAFVRH